MTPTLDSTGFFSGLSCLVALVVMCTLGSCAETARQQVVTHVFVHDGHGGPMLVVAIQNAQCCLERRNVCGTSAYYSVQELSAQLLRMSARWETLNGEVKAPLVPGQKPPARITVVGDPPILRTSDYAFFRTDNREFKEFMDAISLEVCTESNAVCDLPQWVTRHNVLRGVFGLRGAPAQPDSSGSSLESVADESVPVGVTPKNNE